MSQADRDKWDARYREGAYADRTHPSALVVEWLPRLEIRSAKPRAADIACGAGRNALYLARQGFEVDAIDISDVALERLAAAAAAEKLAITCIVADLENPTRLPNTLSEAECYDLVILVRYTNLPLIETLARVLKPGGYLIVEEHLQTEADVVGPSNPRFRVAPGALRKAVAPLEIVEDREGIVEEVDGRIAALAQVIARKL